MKTLLPSRDRWGNLTIAALLFIAQACCLALAIRHQTTLGLPHYLGFGATVVLALLAGLNRTWFCYALGLTLALGVENYLLFTPDAEQTYYLFFQTPMHFQSFSFALLVMWCIFSFGRVKGDLRALFA